MPPPLVRIASRLPGGDLTRPSVSAQSNSSRRSDTRRIPARLERGIIDRVRTGQRAGVGRSRFRALRHAAGFDDHDRLDPGGGARRRHELAGVLDRFDIEQDRACLAVQREIIEQIGDIDVELVADRNDPGKADRALRRPIHHACGNGAGLRDQRQISRAGHVRGEAGIETGTGHHDAETIRARSAACRICAQPVPPHPPANPDHGRARRVTISAPAAPQPACFIDEPCECDLPAR